MRMVLDFFPRIYAQVVLHHPIATTSHFQFYCVCLLLNFWSWFSLLCADGEPCKVIKLHPFSKQDALAADVARDHLYVHMRYGAHGSLIQIYSPLACSKETYLCNVSTDRNIVFLHIYFENDWTQHLLVEKLYLACSLLNDLQNYGIFYTNILLFYPWTNFPSLYVQIASMETRKARVGGLIYPLLLPCTVLLGLHHQFPTFPAQNALKFSLL